MKTIIIGVFGTSLMTLFVYLFSYLLKKRLMVIEVLGTMLTNQTTPNKNLSYKWAALFTGTFIHYLVGIGFAYVYLLLWLGGIQQPTFPNTMLNGFINGLFAVLVWRLFIFFHPNPPRLSLNIFLLFIFLGHLILAAGYYCSYTLLFQ